MSTLKDNLSSVLQRISAALSQLSESDINKLLDDEYTIKIKLVRMRGKEGPDATLTDIDIPALVTKLTEFPSRENAQSFLDENFGSRKLLEPIARSLDIPIIKQDKVDVLRDKIIEATVGARVRSQAIQGNRVSTLFEG